MKASVRVVLPMFASGSLPSGMGLCLLPVGVRCMLTSQASQGCHGNINRRKLHYGLVNKLYFYVMPSVLQNF